MYYYKAPDSSLHALNSEEDSIHLPSDYVKITTEEFKALVTPTKTVSQLMLEYEAVIPTKLDNVAKEWKYDSMTEVATYLTSKVAKFKAEAETLIAWRDSTWEACYSTIAKIEAGTTGAPTNLEEFLATLPAVPTKL